MKGHNAPYKKILDMFGIYLFLSFAGCVMVVFRPYVGGRMAYVFLIWNLFLAWIPFGASAANYFIYTSHRKGLLRTLLILGGSAAWLAFYPNAPYLITDFIHLSYMDLFTSKTAGASFIVWYDFIMFALFILTGFLLGFVSLLLMQKIVAHRFNRAAGWILVVFTLVLGSFGIYLGRFIRWNSWDIVSNPSALAGSIMENLNVYSLSFTVAFSLFMMLIYFALYYLTMLNVQGLFSKPETERGIQQPDYK